MGVNDLLMVVSASSIQQPYVFVAQMRDAAELIGRAFYNIQSRTK
jgi:hypothetical protein